MDHVEFAIPTETIWAIVDRAIEMAENNGWRYDRVDAQMDICAAHWSCPLATGRLLAADDFNFAHDVFGIRRHLDRENGKLVDCFLPRFRDRRFTAERSA